MTEQQQQQHRPSTNGTGTRNQPINQGKIEGGGNKARDRKIAERDRKKARRKKARSKQQKKEQQPINNFVRISWKLLLLSALSICIIFGGIAEYYRIGTVKQKIKVLFAIPPEILEKQQLMSLPSLPQCNSSCLSNFGKDGEWIQDWNFAAEYGQYEEPWVSPAGPLNQRQDMRFRPQEDAPFRWPTSWKWVDKDPACPVDPMTQSTMCNILVQLNISRIAFYGDSLTQQQYTSFLNLMGHRHIMVPSQTSSSKNTKVLLCNITEDSNHYVTLFHKRDEGGQAFPSSERTAYKLHEDIELSAFIDESPQRFLGVFNLGAHYHNLSWYKEDMVEMVKSLESFNRSQDLYFFRTTAPGHKNFFPKNRRGFNWTQGTRDVPLYSYTEFRNKSWSTNYDWNMYEHYNEFTKKTIHEWGTQTQTMHVIDVYNMTALRSDGHVDGLHYMLPGPVDWWNHLFFTYLKELRKVLVNLNGMNCVP